MSEESNSSNIVKYAVAGAVGIGVGVAGYAAYDTPTTQTTQYQNLQDNLTQAQNNADDFEEQVKDLQTTVTDKEEKVSNLEAQVEQFNTLVEELRAENADLEDAVATAQERVGLVDYLPVFSDSDVQFETDRLNVVVDQSAEEGDYDRITANYTSDKGGEYDVEITEYEESEDAEDAVKDFRETNSPIEFTSNGDTHTVELSGYTGQMDQIQFEYSDADAIEDVDHKDDVVSVTVDGDDITDQVEEVTHYTNGKNLRVHFDKDYYVNDGETITVTYEGATDEGELEDVEVSSDYTYFEYDRSSDSREDIYRDGNTVVEITGDRNGDEFEAQYADLASQYE